MARTSPPSSPVPEEWKRRIARELEEGEKLLWVGQPDPAMAMCRNLLLIAAGMAILLFMLLFVLWLSWESIRQGQLGSMVPPGVLLLLIVGLLLLLPWRRRRARRTCYALTARRALVFLPTLLGKMRLTSYFPDQLRQARFERSWFFGPEAGDWVFRQEITTRITRHYDQSNLEPVKEEVARGVKSYGFLSLRHAQEIEPLLRRVAGGK